MRITLDFDAFRDDPKTDQLLDALRNNVACADLMILDDRTVPWFPREISDLDFVANRTLAAGSDLQSDHPGFNDPVYRARRGELAKFAECYKAGHDIPRVEYTDVEIETWGKVYRFMSSLHKQYACQEYLNIVPLMEKHCGFSEDNIPQVQDISAFLKGRTGFTLRPVAGLLSSRDFLNGLAFRIFFSTQYIRHHSMPLYTPEPGKLYILSHFHCLSQSLLILGFVCCFVDICHELLGHAPMFADAEFADFSQEIGLASLGATDEEVGKLVALYWFTVEFGMIRDPETKETKAFGAGLLSSCGELEYSCTAERRREMTNNENKALEHGSKFHEYWMMQDAEIAIPDLLAFDPPVTSTTEFPITHYQPAYFVAEDLNEVKLKIRDYCEKLPKPFNVRYNAAKGHVWVDKAVKRAPHNATSAY